MKTHTDERGLTRFFLEPKDAKSLADPQICPEPTTSEVKTIQAMGRISRASLEESTQRALAIHQDVKIPDGPIVIDRDLLLDIRDSLDNEASDGNEYCAHLRGKLDKIYPFLC